MNVEVCKFMVVTTKGRNKEQYLWMKLDLVVAVSYSILIGRVFFYWAIAYLKRNAILTNYQYLHQTFK